jgi:hypothetical protein
MLEKIHEVMTDEADDRFLEGNPSAVRTLL